MKRYIINKYRYMEAFSHFISTDDCTAHSCRRTGRRGCLSCTPTLHLLIYFFSQASIFPQKETKKGSLNALCIHAKHHVKKCYHPTLPPLCCETPTKQEIPRVLRQSAGFLRSRTRLGGAEQPGCSLGQVRSRVPSRELLPLPEPVLHLSPSPASLPLKYNPARLIKGKKRGVLDDWD